MFLNNPAMYLLIILIYPFDKKPMLCIFVDFY